MEYHGSRRANSRATMGESPRAVKRKLRASVDGLGKDSTGLRQGSVAVTFSVNQQKVDGARDDSISIQRSSDAPCAAIVHSST